jgi:hypothetical protein
MKTLSDDKFGLGSEHVRRRAEQVRRSSNSNGHIVHRHVWSKTGHIQKTSLESDKGTGQVQWTGLVLEHVQPV